jgi:hypothetical protein
MESNENALEGRLNQIICSQEHSKVVGGRALEIKAGQASPL